MLDGLLTRRRRQGTPTPISSIGILAHFGGFHVSRETSCDGAQHDSSTIALKDPNQRKEQEGPSVPLDTTRYRSASDVLKQMKTDRRK